MSGKTYAVSGMHCASCAAIITKKLSKIDGVSTADVNLATEQAKIEFSGAPLSDEALNELLGPYGYGLEAIEQNKSAPSATSPAPSAAEQRKMEKELELQAQFRRVRVALPLALLFFAAMMWEIAARAISSLPPLPFDMETYDGITLLVASFMVFKLGAPFLRAIVTFARTGAANMDTLIGLGTVVAWTHSTFVTLFPHLRDALGLPHDTYFDAAIVVIGFVLLGKYLETRSRLKTGAAIEKLIGLQSKSALVRRGDTEVELPIEQLRSGDLVVVRPGGRIPVDGVIVEGSSTIDESMVTGEPLPVDRRPDDPVIGGTINRQGAFVFRASKVGKETLLSKIIAMVEEAQGSKAPIQTIADRIAAIFVPAVLVVAIITFVLWITVGQAFLGFQTALSYGIMGLVGILVIACPCALGLATPTAIIVGIGKGAEYGILIRNAGSLETLASIDTVLFDKTGTITRGVPSVTDLLPSEKSISPQRLLQLAASIESRSEHPLAQAITSAAREKNEALLLVDRFESLEGVGVRGIVEGKSVRVRKPELNEESPRIRELQQQGKTVVMVEENGLVCGLIALSDTIKAEAPEAVRALQGLGIRVIMLTGDNRMAAAYMAKQAGIDEVIAEVLPTGKAMALKELQQKGRKVAMIGDGINDAPALAIADVGIAMATGTDIAIESAGVTIIRGDLGKVVQSMVLSRATMRVIRQNLFWAFIYNIVGIPLAAGALYPLLGIVLNPVFSGIAMAGSSVSVVANSLRLKARRL